jgi:protein SCO1/2
VKGSSVVRVGLIAGIAIAAGIAASLWRRQHVVDARPPEIGGYVLPQPRALDAFELVDETGARFVPRDFTGRWSFLYFGYTYCPDVCPLTLVELGEVKKKLAERTPGAAASFYFVSVDPDRDTPDRLREYVTYFDPEFRGLTGDPAQIAALAHAVGAVYFVQPGQSEKSYLVSHSSNIALLDPSGGLRAVFTAPHVAAQVADDFAAIFARYGTATPPGKTGPTHDRQ